MACCTTAQVKTRLEISGASADTVLGQIVTGVTSMLEAHCMRKLARPAAAVTEYSHGGAKVIWLEHFPAISVTSIKEALHHDHAGEDALTANEDYVLHDARGALQRIGNNWLEGLDAVQVVYLGGYTDPGDTPGDGEIAMPDAVVEAAIQQCCFVYQRRRELGLTSVGVSGGSVSAYARDKLLPGVKELLAPYRRVVF